MTARTSLTPAVTRRQLDEPAPGGPATRGARGWSCRCRAAPRGQRDRPRSTSPSTSRRSGAPGASRCSWPTTSSSVRGRIRTASGAGRRATACRPPRRTGASGALPVVGVVETRRGSPSGLHAPAATGPHARGPCGPVVLVASAGSWPSPVGLRRSIAGLLAARPACSPGSRWLGASDRHGVHHRRTTSSPTVADDGVAAARAWSTACPGRPTRPHPAWTAAAEVTRPCGRRDVVRVTTAADHGRAPATRPLTAAARRASWSSSSRTWPDDDGARGGRRRRRSGQAVGSGARGRRPSAAPSARSDEINEQVETRHSQAGEAVALPLSLLGHGVRLRRACSPPGCRSSGRSPSIAGGLLACSGSLTSIDLCDYLSVVSVIGLGLCIDYGLLLVSRYREELRRLHDAGDDVRPAALEGPWSTPWARPGAPCSSARDGRDQPVGPDVLRAADPAGVGAAGVSVVVVALLGALTLVPALASPGTADPARRHPRSRVCAGSPAAGDVAPTGARSPPGAPRAAAGPPWWRLAVLAFLVVAGVAGPLA